MRFFTKRPRNHSTVEIDARRILNDNTPFAIREAYRTLYTNVLYLPIESSTKKLALTSAIPGEGKSIASLNLAKTIAINSPDSKVLLIDADMRSPRICDLLGIDGHKQSGFSEYLAGIDKTPAILPTENSNLFVFPSGAVNVNTPGLIASNRMKTLMASLEDEYDYIIFDTPPINVVSDALLLKDYVNGYLITVRSEFSNINYTSDAIDALNKAEVNIFGLILMAHNAKSSAGFGRYSKTGSKYGYGYSRYEK